MLRGKTAATREAFRTRVPRLRARACARRPRRRPRRSTQLTRTRRRSARRSAPRTRRRSRTRTARAPKKRNAFGKCVSEHARENEQEADQEDRQDAVAFKNAAKECAAERERLGDDDFAEEYGRNANDRNAFGKCVSKKARENEAEQPES